MSRVAARPVHRSWALAAVLVLIASISAEPSGHATAGPGLIAAVRPVVDLSDVVRVGRPEHPPTFQECEQQHIHCYSPTQIEKIYGTTSLYNRGVTGRGRTIAIIDPFGSPTARSDLDTFDAAFGLPAPPSFKIIAPAGKIPPYDPKQRPEMAGWALETALDVQSAHAMAPEANILLVETPTNESEGAAGFPEIVKAANYVVDHHRADVISLSLVATENTFPTKQSLLDLRSAFRNARAHRVTVVAASGDMGATGFESDDSLYPYRVSGWPSTDPLVTSVGGTRVTADQEGQRVVPDAVWNDSGAGGGGVSAVFPRPAFQDGERAVVGDARGVPDVSMLASGKGGEIIYLGIPGFRTFLVLGGTSAAAPLFAGIVALADQDAGTRLGDINPALYTLAGQTRSGIVDITKGTNSFAGVTGYVAKPGYDLASGLGTVNAATFVPALAAVASR